jgi:peptidoglycan/xylan/chitin deacetylase (PgdA/CDA1 family)
VTLDISYDSYRNITQEGGDFVFHFGSNDQIHIPTSSFFFDLYHAQSPSLVSGEVVPTGKKIIALTFDDGPSSKYTPILLDILKSE